ncbi:S-methyl-5'-thioadenosine phosphorylase [Salinirubellus sp. GCM10025818]|uniref:S-methyl-5'-thioadenosine phosphorylase n=1 Tax=Salinirubellus TaxID=2162630 RepID=UPI0030D1A6CB
MPIGFVGGSGIYEALDLENESEVAVSTPFGDPAAPVTVGALDGTEIAFLPRHGRDHEFSPTTTPYRANLHALKSLGCERVLSSNAVGSLREDLPPRTLLVPDQLFDRTRDRPYTFFDEGVVVHAAFGQPYCPHMVEHLTASAAGVDVDCERGGTYVCIEGPQFSTVAESEFYRDQGFDVVGMTAVPEAKLAREAELCYATVAGVTDFDVWKEGAEVTQEEVVENALANETNIKEVVERAVEAMPEQRECDCGSALDGAVATDPGSVDAEARERYGTLLGDYL